MYCKHCGAQLNDNANFCPYCGQAQSTSPQQPQQPQKAQQPQPQFQPAQPQFQQPQQPTYTMANDPRWEEKKSQMAGECLKWGILSLAFVVSGCLALLGFIFSFTAKKKVAEYVQYFGQVEGRARVGRDLGKAGFIAGLAMTIFWVVYFFILILAMAAAL